MEHNRQNIMDLILRGIEREGYSVTGLEREAGVPKDSIRDFMRGKAQVLRADKLQKILGILQPPGKIRIGGVVSDNAEIITIPGGTNETVDCPPGYPEEDVVALKIISAAMVPVFHKDWIVYYTGARNAGVAGKLKNGWQVPYNKRGKGAAAAHEQDPLFEFFGKPCIVQMKKSKMMLRTLKPGSQPGRYHLISYNAGDIKNAEVEWAAKIIFIKT